MAFIWFYYMAFIWFFHELLIIFYEVFVKIKISRQLCNRLVYYDVITFQLVLNTSSAVEDLFHFINKPVTKSLTSYIEKTMSGNSTSSGYSVSYHWYLFYGCLQVSVCLSVCELSLISIIWMSAGICMSVCLRVIINICSMAVCGYLYVYWVIINIYYLDVCRYLYVCELSLIYIINILYILWMSACLYVCTSL